MASSGIPLHCTICPKRPNFSDVSHLLTHISSKGHLSNYYKVKVRSTHEEASRRLIEAYDRWYADWNVEELMSNRMNQKDKRRTRPRPAARPALPPRIEAPMPRPARRAAVGNLLDPRLSDQQVIKVEHSATPGPTPQPGPVLRHRTFASHMQVHHWGTESRGSSRSFTNPDYDTSSEYSDPSERRRYRYAVPDSCAIEDDPLDAAEDPMAVSESTKLKGVYWPGMDIFDSATPEMRRKRNQKKDHSVVEQLEMNSLEVEATELVFTPKGSLKRQRRISNSEYDEEDEIEIKMESPLSSRLRPVLGNLDANASRRPKHLARTQLFPVFSHPSYDDNYGRTTFDHGYDDHHSKRKRAFDIFQDEDNVIFSHQTGMSHLNSGFPHQQSPTPAQAFHPYKTFNEPYQYENKENALPSFHHTVHGTFPNGHPAAHQYQPFAYSFGQEHHGGHYNSQLFNGSGMYTQHATEDDDQRTVTAPASPSTN